MAVCNDHSFALDQLLVMFDYQTRLGILPDFITEKYPIYGAFKPPVYGLTMQKMAEGAKKLREATDRAIIGIFGGNLFEGLTDSMVEPNIVAYSRILWFSVPLGVLGIWLVARITPRTLVTSGS